MNGRGDTAGLVKGTLDLLILSGLGRGPMHGYGISTWLEERSGGDLGVEDSAVYQALHRLEERGLIEAEWGRTENNRRARFYRLTAAGRDRLEQGTAAWDRYARSVDDILAASRRAR